MKEIIIVTGASSGMGREFAMQIEKKYQVDEIWVIARRKERLECLKEKLQTKVKIFALDLTQKESFEIIQEALFQEKPRVKALINCSGYGKPETITLCSSLKSSMRMAIYHFSDAIYLINTTGVNQV